MVSRSNTPLIETRAFLLSRVDYGEADFIVSLLTERLGRISCLARGARRDRSKFQGALEPLHTLRVGLVPSLRSEFVPLREASLLVPRRQLTEHLPEMRVAGQALRWVRKAAPPKTPEDAAFSALTAFLDELDQQAGHQNVEAKLAAFGLRALAAFGWGLQLSGCVSCGRPCPAERPALLNPERGGLVCRKCGGAPIQVTAEQLAQMRDAGQSNSTFPDFTQVSQVLKIIDRALVAHFGFDPSAGG